MIIGVMSDTHCIEKYINLAFEKMKNADVILHLGDCSPDIAKFKDKFNGEVYVVDGNCDFKGDYPKERLLEIQNKKIFMAHGDRYGVKNDFNNIYYRGKELGADIVLFGHSHIEMIQEVNDMLLMNPGSASLPKGKGNSIGIIEIDDNGNIDAKIEYLV